MTMESCRDLASYEDGDSYIKAIYTGMGPSYRSSYVVCAYIQGTSYRQYFITQYDAMKFYEKLCFMIEQNCIEQFIK